MNLMIMEIFFISYCILTENLCI